MKCVCSVGCTLVVAVVTVLFARAERCLSAEIWIGTAETSITPDRPVSLEGFFHLRISEGVASPITASVVIVESRQGDEVVERSIMVSADLVHLPWELLEAVRENVVREVPDIDTSKIFISVTHTHSAPVVMRGNFILPDGVMTIEEYGRFFAQRVARAIVEAYGSLQPGSVAWGLGFANVAYNRRAAYFGGRSQMYGPTVAPDFKGPEGPEYQGIPTLFFFDRDGKPLGAAVNVWSPSQELDSPRNHISADFWHPVRVRLKEELGSAFTVLAWCGPAGDQGRIGDFTPRRKTACGDCAA